LRTAKEKFYFFQRTLKVNQINNVFPSCKLPGEDAKQVGLTVGLLVFGFYD